MKRHIFLTGYRGTGKTAVGNALAVRLGLELIDLDALIQQRAGCSIADIFAAHGEPHFRRLESEALGSLGDQSAAVVSLGGGAVLPEENRQLIQQTGRCVLLTATAETIAARLQADALSATQRPSLTDMAGIDEIRHLLQARRAAYHAVADVEIDTEQRTVDAIADQIVRWLTEDNERDLGWPLP